MTQEIITYIIIALAFGWAGYKIFRKFNRKKTTKKSSISKKPNFTLHKCDDCSAECMLRNTVKPIRLNEPDLCRKIEI